MLLIIINGERDKRSFKFLSWHRIVFISLWRSQSTDDVLWSFLWLEQNKIVEMRFKFQMGMDGNGSEVIEMGGIRYEKSVSAHLYSLPTRLSSTIGMLTYIIISMQRDTCVVWTLKVCLFWNVFFLSRAFYFSHDRLFLNLDFFLLFSVLLNTFFNVF